MLEVKRRLIDDFRASGARYNHHHIKRPYTRNLDASDTLRVARGFSELKARMKAQAQVRFFKAICKPKSWAQVQSA
jgi:hypothetical protein